LALFLLGLGNALKKRFITPCGAACTTLEVCATSMRHISMEILVQCILHWCQSTQDAVGAYRSPSWPTDARIDNQPRLGAVNDACDAPRRPNQQPHVLRLEERFKRHQHGAQSGVLNHWERGALRQDHRQQHRLTWCALQNPNPLFPPPLSLTEAQRGGRVPAKLLYARGVDMVRVEMIPDVKEDIVASVRGLSERVGSDGFVFTSGGIGVRCLLSTLP
jgi:hypothetical protein